MKQIKEKLLELLHKQNKQGDFEYVASGFISPEHTAMLALITICLGVSLIIGQYVKLNIAYSITAALLIFFVVLQLLYTQVVIAKSAKRVFIYRKKMMKKEMIDIVPMRNFKYLEDGCDSHHINVLLKLEGKNHRITFNFKDKKHDEQAVTQFEQDLIKGTE